MLPRNEDFIQSSLNPDLTISRCKRKLINLKKYIKSISYANYRTYSKNSQDLQEFSQKTNANKVTHFQYSKNSPVKYRTHENDFNGEKDGTLFQENLEDRISGLDSEVTSYGSSFIDKMIDKYNTSEIGIDEINYFKGGKTPFCSDFRNDTHKEHFKLSKSNSKDVKIYNKLDTEKYIDGIPCFHPSNKTQTFSGGSTARIEDSQIAINQNLVNQLDLETREIVENLDKKIKNLEEFMICEKNRTRIQKNELNYNMNVLDPEYLERFNNLESKLLSIAIHPPCGVPYFESSFLPYLCTWEELNVIKDFVSIKRKLDQDDVEIKSIGKIFCYYSRKRFVNYIRRLYNVSLSLLKLKLLIFIGEPEILLVNTLGPNPLSSREEFKFYDFNMLYKIQKISRFLICLIAIDGTSNFCFVHGCYSVTNTKQILPIYIINISSES